MQKSKIEWCSHVSNPIKGKCYHVCKYCYAEKIRLRFKQPEQLSFHIKELWAIQSRKKPATIFMGSAYDIFGDWVKTEYIEKILETVDRCPQHKFIFLTKNPKRYCQFVFPDNCYIGYSDDGTKDERNWTYFLGKKNRFISIEPLIGNTININPDLVDGIILGAMTGHNAIKPKFEVVEAIINAIGDKPLFIKDNLLKIHPKLHSRKELIW